MGWRQGNFRIFILFLVNQLPNLFSEFLNKTPIPNPALEAAKWVLGAPTPIQEGLMSPNTEAINLIAGFASGHITIDGNDLKHISSISKCLSEVWETPEKWVPVDSGTIGAGKMVIAQKEPCKMSLGKLLKKSHIQGSQTQKLNYQI